MADVNFQERLEFQLGEIRRHCRDYDNGDQQAALAVAVNCRNLFHSTSRQTPLLKRVAGDRWQDVRLRSFISKHFEQCLESPSIRFAGTLYQIRENRIVPALGNGPDGRRVIPLLGWWNAVFFRSAGHHMARCDIILQTANKYYAHTDAALSDACQQLIDAPISKEAALGMAILSRMLFGAVTKIDGGPGQVHRAVLRSIGEEVLSSDELLKLLEPKAT